MKTKTLVIAMLVSLFAAAAAAQEARGAGEDQTLTNAQKAAVKEIISKYKADTLTANDAKAIHRALRDAGVRGGPTEDRAISEAGFDPEKLKELDPPPSRLGKNSERQKTEVGSQKSEGKGQGGGSKYTLEQACSDNAQLKTIAFDGLAYITGDFGFDTFLPPGKVSDYFGFQYMRDIDGKEGGHNTSFLTSIASNMLKTLSSEQRAMLLSAAKEQEADIKKFAEMRLPLIKAFRRNLEGDYPSGKKALDKAAVLKYSASLYELDGVIAYKRAEVMGKVISSFTTEQKATLAKLKFGDSRTWPDIPEQLDKRSMSHSQNVAVMTYASEMFAWYAGSLEADTYFCPERHGMYFGGFGMKTAPAMGKQNYSISTSLTGDSGEAFLNALDVSQKKKITEIVDLQRKDLAEIVTVRRAISAELRRFQKGETADKAKVLSLSKRYGELDGELAYFYASAFGEVGKSLTSGQKAKLAAMRTINPSEPRGPFLYSDPLPNPSIPNTDFFFGK
ncbi:MAG: hypothetical protein WCI43_05770 [Candidatus Firestonebacteria bacterium]